jgi:hypothetical protein
MLKHIKLGTPCAPSAMCLFAYPQTFRSKCVQVTGRRLDIVKRKVRRVHIGTHGAEVHDFLRTLLATAGWEVIFDYAPYSRHMTSQGPLDLGDGILTARNPAV